MLRLLTSKLGHHLFLSRSPVPELTKGFHVSASKVRAVGRFYEVSGARIHQQAVVVPAVRFQTVRDELSQFRPNRLVIFAAYQQELRLGPFNLKRQFSFATSG